MKKLTPDWKYKNMQTNVRNKQNPDSRSRVSESETSVFLSPFQKTETGYNRVDIILTVRKYLGSELISEKWEVKERWVALEWRKKKERKWVMGNEVRFEECDSQKGISEETWDESGFQVTPESKYDLSTTFYLGKMDLDYESTTTKRIKQKCFGFWVSSFFLVENFWLFMKWNDREWRDWTRGRNKWSFFKINIKSLKFFILFL